MRAKQSSELKKLTLSDNERPGYLPKLWKIWLSA